MNESDKIIQESPEGPQQSEEGWRQEFIDAGLLPNPNQEWGMAMTGAPLMPEPMLDIYENGMRQLQETIRDQRSQYDGLWKAHVALDERNRRYENLIRYWREVVYPMPIQHYRVLIEAIDYALSGAP